MEDIELAHQDYELRKTHIIADLSLLSNYANNESVKFILKNAIEFIREKEI